MRFGLKRKALKTNIRGLKQGKGVSSQGTTLNIVYSNSTIIISDLENSWRTMQITRNMRARTTRIPIETGSTNKESLFLTVGSSVKCKDVRHDSIMALKYLNLCKRLDFS